MFMTDVNNVKIYNLSAGKSLPDWLEERKKRSKSKKKSNLNNNIELIQDFCMPGVATSVNMTPDNQYIIATGTYKPRVKCYEVSNLSIKFERCFDSEVSRFEVLSDDYSKMVFLQCDRYVEVHAAHGRHYRLRIPRFGLDMKYDRPTCDLIIVGTSSDIYRLNLERGQFLQPYASEYSCLNSCAINTEQHLICAGSKEGTIETFDPRERKKCSTLDVAFNLPNTKQFPSISCINFKNGLQMAVGTGSGHVLLYDIRSKEPLLIKDHLNKFPIKRIEFNKNLGKVYSLDSAMLKIWDESTGKQTAYIESMTNFNDFCTIPDTGLFFMAQEDIKMLTYYIPAMGVAPKWCSFLDNLTEEIESEVIDNIFDDYQFVTVKDLEELGLDHLIGTNLLRAYMHGYFIDTRLHKKAKAIVEPFEFDRYRKEKIRQEIESKRPSRLQFAKASNLPKVNQDLALQIIDKTQTINSKKLPNLLEDKRFSAMFENTDYTIDRNAEEYKMLAPVLNRLEKSKAKELKRKIEISQVHLLHADEENPIEDDNDEDLFNESSDEDDVKEFSKEMKTAYKDIKKHKQDENDGESEAEAEAKSADIEDPANSFPSLSKMGDKTKMFDISNGTEFKINSLKQRASKVSLKDRVNKEMLRTAGISSNGSRGNKTMVFDTQKMSREMKKREYEMKKHREERKKVTRSTNSLKLKKVHFK